MNLSDLLKELTGVSICGNANAVITKVIHDSREAEKGCLFVCIRGSVTCGCEFITEALDAGATAIVIEKGYILKKNIKRRISEINGAIVEVPDTRFAMAYIAAAFYGNPAKYLTTIGITGTKGKTTTAYLIHNILTGAGLKVGLIGTIETIIGIKHIPSVNTTPESILLQSYMAQMVEEGVDAVVMEVSSQGLKLSRTEGFVFDYGIFTNFGEDHIGVGEHADLGEYLECKSMLFKQCRVGIINCDDLKWQQLLRGHTCSVETYGFSKNADYRVLSTKLCNDNGKLNVHFKATVQNEDNIYDFQTSTPGRFSIYNSLAAIALCGHFGVDIYKIGEVLASSYVKGRMEIVDINKDYILMIDYAHNALSLRSILKTLKEYKTGRIICLFGCGGNRSKLRRIEMGQVSGELADFTIITSDNPRYEEPQAIIEDIKSGLIPTGGKFAEICDRKEAIAYGMSIADKGDILLLAGKGHEDYQEICGKKYPMDERVIVKEILKKEGYKWADLQML